MVEALVVPFTSVVEAELELDMFELLPDVVPLFVVPLLVVPLVVPFDIVLLVVPLSVVPAVLVVLQPNSVRLNVSTAMRGRTALRVRFIV